MIRAYFQLFFGLLIPLSGLFVIVAVIYFRIDYDFTKSLRLGVLAGVFIGITVSIITALFLLIMRRGKKPQNSILDRKKKQSSKTVVSPKPDNITHVDSSKGKHTETAENKVTTLKTNTDNNHTLIEQKLMLLMDKELAFEVALYAIADQDIGTLTESKNNEAYITVKNDNETLQFSIVTLTRHTAQMIIHSMPNSPAAKQIIGYMKEKEHSFLQY